ncbi:J domain-containing protein [Sphingomonas sp. ABOLD]|uniref:DnaJ-domain-containing protein 1 n=1 Tax=Sphingomonas trueperi TaxID=53317 RepID=A0A7X6BAS8_9SPHN|nr:MULTISPECIES: J domain-containing protein [Sphingomonas]NJB96244.1 DnaJ-domain-containing protein 1 [Sphingomonas trueperi]RSV45001.1 J domain-containing protein [Sphingomonas sp. ABOLE]RSV51194.1 J domain-containing protein [Sphingomonas sp. ABOLD]
MAKLLIAAALLYILWRWLQPKKKAPAAPPPRLGESEARAILGVDAAAGPAEIRAAHRRLVSALHPDKGGSAELTRRINLARDTLLRG